MKQLSELFANLGNAIGDLVEHPECPYVIKQELMDVTTNLSTYHSASDYSREALIARAVFPVDLMHIIESKDAVKAVIVDLEAKAKA